MTLRPSVRLAALPLVCALPALLSGCLPASVGPDLGRLTVVPDAAWEPADLIYRSLLPQARVLPLAEAIRRAPVGSVIVACQTTRALWGACTHLTRKVGAATLSEETGVIGTGARLRPADSLLDRDLILVIDAGVREQHLDALNAGIRRLSGAPYQLNGQLNAFDCSTYQNALQRAAGLPDAVPLDPRWGAFLPLGALNVPGHSLLWAGVSDRVTVAPVTPSP